MTVLESLIVYLLMQILCLISHGFGKVTIRCWISAKNGLLQTSGRTVETCSLILGTTYLPHIKAPFHPVISPDALAIRPLVFEFGDAKFLNGGTGVSALVAVLEKQL